MGRDSGSREGIRPRAERCLRRKNVFLTRRTSFSQPNKHLPPGRSDFPRRKRSSPWGERLSRLQAPHLPGRNALPPRKSTSPHGRSRRAAGNEAKTREGRRSEAANEAPRPGLRPCPPARRRPVLGTDEKPPAQPLPQPGEDVCAPVHTFPRSGRGSRSLASGFPRAGSERGPRTQGQVPVRADLAPFQDPNALQTTVSFIRSRPW